ncbi:MAG: hypothetical protein IT328_09020 [Caldilineaceae bacterium]|nr:hypothetical protein [Caldilineaceae bacterium]
MSEAATSSDTTNQTTTNQATTPPVAVAVGNPPAAGTTGTDGAATETLYCANHPDTETLLRCNRCGKPICLKCAVLTDVGYRCKECIRGVQSSYFNAIPTDNLVGFGVALLVTAIASPIAGFIFARFAFGFFGIIIAFMLGSGAGGMLAQIIRSAVGRRRGRYLRHFALGGIILGVLIGGVIGLFFGIPVLNISTLIFAVLSSATAYQILR